jgi:DNA-binding PadR family transcriptional regulator
MNQKSLNIGHKENAFLISEIEEIIISILRIEEMYGLQISKTIELRSNGKLIIGFGSLYPALRRLESKGFLESHWGEEEIEERGGARRRYYSVTPKGKKILQEKINIRKSVFDNTLVFA